MLPDESELNPAGHQETAVTSIEERVQRLETEQLVSRKEQLLFPCYLALVLVHGVAFFNLIYASFRADSAFPAWTAAGGMGSLAVWFSWTARPLKYRLPIAISSVLLVYMISSLALPFYAQTQRQELRTQVRSFLTSFGAQKPTNQVLARSFFPSHTEQSQQMLRGRLLGAFLAAYCCTWFTGRRIAPLGQGSPRRPLSIRSIFVMTVIAAVASQFVGRDYLFQKSMFYTNGMTSGFVAASIAWGVFQQQRRRMAFVPLVAILGVVTIDVTAGWLVGAWRGSVLTRYREVSGFVVASAISPLLTFGTLRLLGYQMISPQKNTDLPAADDPLLDAES